MISIRCLKKFVQNLVQKLNKNPDFRFQGSFYAVFDFGIGDASSDNRPFVIDDAFKLLKN